MAVTSALHAQILGAINSVRPFLYGADFSVDLLRFNGVDKQYTPLLTILTDFIPSFDRSGNMTLMVSTNEFSSILRDTTDVVFNGWIYHFTEPAKPEQGPFPMWKATGRPTGNRYILES